jgi:hypothetical protein
MNIRASEVSSLPLSSRVDAATLSRLFSDTTTSYKYLWFQAILSELVSTRFQQANIELKDLLSRTLTHAWYPKVFFRLSFGMQDKVGHWFDRGPIELEGTIGDDVISQAILKRINTEGDSGLLRYVPYRILSPFFEAQVVGCPDHRKNALIRQLADYHFDDRKPLYRFQSESEIQIHPDWLDYLATNFSIVTGWSNWNWLQFLQQNNSNVPAIANKLRIPLDRNSIANQRKYWRLAQRNKPINCIYSGDPLSFQDISLDHFLPWSFVGHDQLWNLIPVSSSANSAKNNQLPHECYVEKFILIQHSALHETKVTMSRSEWRTAVESHLNDLHLDSFDALLNLNALAVAYRATIHPLMSIAQRMGFGHGWQY